MIFPTFTLMDSGQDWVRQNTVNVWKAYPSLDVVLYCIGAESGEGLLRIWRGNYRVLSGKMTLVLHLHVQFYNSLSQIGFIFKPVGYHWKPKL